MAMVSDSTTENEETGSFNMGALQANLPQKRGLSRYYSGKSRSFTCIADVHCVEDLKKPDVEGGKKRKKYSERRAAMETNFPPYPCRRVSSSAHFAAPCLGF